MTPNRGRIICHLTALLISLPASGCYVPGGGWTMRTGIDLRRHAKPSAFVELVDTRWDEYNRIAEINAFTPTTTVLPATFAPGPAPGPGPGPGLMEGISVPPATEPAIAPESSRAFQPGSNDSPASTPPAPQFPGASSGGDSAGISPTDDEPSRLPGDADAPAQSPQSSDGPTALKTSLGSTFFGPSANGDAMSASTVAATSAPTPAAKPARRPMASRLFSRPQ